MDSSLGPTFGRPAGAADAALVKDGSLASFAADVIQPSMQTPVLVDFWAPWCGPCKQLSPILEKVVAAQGGKVRLVKINVDEPENQPLAQQLRIQSIPAVYAFKSGQPVDGFLGALPESQVKQFIDRLLDGEGLANPLDDILAEAQAALEAGEAQAALELFEEARTVEPENVLALAGIAKAALALGDPARARAALDKVPPAEANHAEVASARAALALAEQTAGTGGDIGALKARIGGDPADHQARFDLALAYIGAGQREEAVDELLELVRRNRAWNEEAARKQLVTLFEAFGPTDPLTLSGRRRLSSLLFA